MLAAADLNNAGAIVVVTAMTAVVGVAAVQLARALGRWFRRAIVDSVADGVREITAPDLNRLAESVTTAIDELSAAIAHAIQELTVINTEQHAAVDARLKLVEARLLEVEERLLSMEHRIGIRSEQSRTRASDADEDLEE